MALLPGSSSRGGPASRWSPSGSKVTVPRVFLPSSLIQLICRSGCCSRIFASHSAVRPATSLPVEPRVATLLDVVDPVHEQGELLELRPLVVRYGHGGRDFSSPRRSAPGACSGIEDGSSVVAAGSWARRRCGRCGRRPPRTSNVFRTRWLSFFSSRAHAARRLSSISISSCRSASSRANLGRRSTLPDMRAGAPVRRRRMRERRDDLPAESCPARARRPDQRCSPRPSFSSAALLRRNITRSPFFPRTFSRSPSGDTVDELVSNGLRPGASVRRASYEPADDAGSLSYTHRSTDWRGDTSRLVAPLPAVVGRCGEVGERTSGARKKSTKADGGADAND